MKAHLLKEINKPVFIFAVVIYTFLFVLILGFKDQADFIINRILNDTLHNLGWVYILGYVFVFIISIFLAFGPFGRKRLGGDEAKPEYRFFSWIGMLFCAGLGVGLVFYGVSEPVSHFLNSPVAENGSREAAQAAMKITLYHWTVMPWAIYSIVGLAVGYYSYGKGLSPVISTALYPFLGEKGVKGVPGKIVDAFSLIAMICGISMSLGFAATQSTTGIGMEFGFDANFHVVVLAAICIGACALCSALSGLQKGVRLLSEFNTVLVILLILFALIAGPTIQIIKMMLESCGNLFADLPRLMLHVDGFGIVSEKVGFEWVESWTIFYWAWWVAFAPFVGTFLAKISRGRTIREFILACILMPALLCVFWFTAFGGSAMELDLSSFPGLAEEISINTEGSLFVFLKVLPFSKITVVISVILILTLIITSMDSATYMAGVFSYKGEGDVSYSLRVFWAVYIVINAVLMIYLGGLQLLQYTAVALAFPFMIIIILMTAGLIKETRRSSPGEHENKK